MFLEPGGFVSVAFGRLVEENSKTDLALGPSVPLTRPNVGPLGSERHSTLTKSGTLSVALRDRDSMVEAETRVLESEAC